MGARNTRRADASTRSPNLSGHLHASAPGRCQMIGHASTGRGVEEIVDLAPDLRVDAGDLLEVGNGGALDRPEGAEVAQQRALARRADAGDFLQAGLAQVALAFLPMRADREPMRLVAQPLDEVEHRIARLELERGAAG